MAEPNTPPLFGVAATFASAEALVAAAAAARHAALGRVDAYSPVPVPALGAALQLTAPPLPALTLLGFLVGGCGYFGMCVFGTMVGYPINVGGRPSFSWPSFVIPSLSIAAAAGAVMMAFILLVLNRLPRLNHPVFNIDGFERATQDRFFLCIESSGEHFDAGAAQRLLASLPMPPLAIQLVPR